MLLIWVRLVLIHAEALYVPIDTRKIKQVSSFPSSPDCFQPEGISTTAEDDISIFTME